ncbi:MULTISPECIES: hypothetical protein [Gammaproteobacteria]|uniref:hypothetical protein n=1 Tax=Gammaproteobacteria TaxID=1236 RepID=UPI0023603B1B|nr:hypothetical protein [Pseudoalteromonas sp. GABNS16H]MDC9611692.1 hypothetical protein [Pseudoalteromonas sp. GABNS16H]
MVNEITITRLYRQTDDGDILATIVDIYDSSTGDKVGEVTGKTTSPYIYKLDKPSTGVNIVPREANTIIETGEQ